jgi:hypothetical protein
LEDEGFDVRIILKQNFKRCRLDLFGSGYGPVAGLCHYANEYLGYVNRAISPVSKRLLASQERLCSHYMLLRFHLAQHPVIVNHTRVPLINC